MVLPIRNKDVGYVSYTNVTDLCSAFEREYSCLEIPDGEETEKAAKELSKLLEDTIDQQTGYLNYYNNHRIMAKLKGLLYFNGVDSVSISKRLGHARVSTTADIYAHVMAEADQKNADILADIFLKKSAERGVS